MKLVRAGEKDLREIASIAATSKSYWGYSENFLQKCKEHFVGEFNTDYLKNSHTFFIHEEHERIGFGSLYQSDETYLDHLWILPQYIGQGLGKKALNLFISKAQSLGWTSLVIVSDVHAESFYLKMGAIKEGSLFSPLQGLDLPKLKLFIGDN